MSDTRHSPTPWRPKQVTGRVLILDATGEAVAAADGDSCESDPVNAAFIVRAVNAHEALVEALKDARESLRLDGGDRTHDTTLDTIERALALAEGA